MTGSAGLWGVGSEGEGGGGADGGDDAFGGGRGGLCGLHEVRGLEADLVEDALEDGVEAAGADVFGGFVDAEGELGHFGDGFGGEFELEALGFEQRGGLLDERGFGLGEDADEVVDGEGLELDADGEAALEARG